MQRRIKCWLIWLSSRAMVVFATSILAAFAITLWVVSANLGESSESMAIAIAAISAFFAAVSSFGSLLQAIEVQRQRENLERPFIVTYYDLANNGAIYFIVENIGNSPAKDIGIKFEAAPTDHQNRSLEEISLFTNPIEFLPPQRSIRQLVDKGSNVLTGDNLRFSHSVSYSSLRGETYREPGVIDLTYMKDMTRPMKSQEDHLETISNSLDRIHKTLDKIRHSDAINVVAEMRSEREERLKKLTRTVDDGQKDNQT